MDLLELSTILVRDPPRQKSQRASQKTFTKAEIRILISDQTSISGYRLTKDLVGRQNLNISTADCYNCKNRCVFTKQKGVATLPKL